MTNQEKYQAGEVSGIRVILPTTKEAMRDALKAIGVDGIRCRAVFLTEHDSNLSGFCHCINQGDSVDEVNYLCHLLSDMTDTELATFQAVIRYGAHDRNTDDLINLALNIESYDFYMGVDSDKELGHIYADDMGNINIPEDVRPYDKVLGASNLKMLRYEWVWYKSRCTGFLNARRAPLKKTENILVFYQKLPLYQPQFEQGKPYERITKKGFLSSNYGKYIPSGNGSPDGRRFPGNVLAFASVQRTIHPTQKPVELCEYFIRTYTRPGELVTDICAGSGTTAVAALNTGRRYICFETAPAIFGTAVQRIREAEDAVARGGKGV